MSTRQSMMAVLACCIVGQAGCSNVNSTSCGKPDGTTAPIAGETGDADRLMFTRIEAFQSGYMESGWWKLTIEANGAGTLKYTGGGSPRRFRVSAIQLRAIDDLLRQTEFLSMSSVYRGDTSPDESIGRSITVHTPMGHKATRVKDFPSSLGRKERREMRGFFDLWILLKNTLLTEDGELPPQVSSTPDYIKNFIP